MAKFIEIAPNTVSGEFPMTAAFVNTDHILSISNSQTGCIVELTNGTKILVKDMYASLKNELHNLASKA